MKRTKMSLVPVVLAAVASIVTTAAGHRAVSPHRPSPAKIDARPANASGLGRGVNFGNMLEAPAEGAWGFIVEERFFDAVVEAGMDHIRLPVSWTTHTGMAAPYTIDPVFMDRVDWCVDQALARGLKIIVNVHHYDELNADPVAETPRALAMWSQIAQRFAGRPVAGPGAVQFEVLNEPHGAFNDDPALWDAYFAQSLAVIRQTNPTRWVLAGPVRWNSVRALDSFHPPADDRLLISVHYYEPFAFTHQGAGWVDPSPPVGTAWTGAETGFAAPWSDWSWGTSVTPGEGSITVEYQQGWAGLYFRRDSRLNNTTRIGFTVDSPLTLNVIVGSDDGDQAFPVQTGSGTAEYTVDLPAGMSPVEYVMLQNATPNAQSAFTMTDMWIETADGRREPMLATARDAVESAMRRAAGWARARGLPVHLGEFGSYESADMDSRARWTRAVRESAERAGLAWSYWELAAGFGFYDPDAGEFRGPLLEALVD